MRVTVLIIVARSIKRDGVWIGEGPCNSNIVVVGVAARKRQSRQSACIEQILI